ncbi:unnamed protein product, partial [Adineta steineri]
MIYINRYIADTKHFSDYELVVRVWNPINNWYQPREKLFLLFLLIVDNVQQDFHQHILVK